MFSRTQENLIQELMKRLSSADLEYVCEFWKFLMLVCIYMYVLLLLYCVQCSMPSGNDFTMTMRWWFGENHGTIVVILV